MESHSLTEEFLESCDLAIIATDHSGIDYAWVTQHVQHVLDTRNASKGMDGYKERITLL